MTGKLLAQAQERHVLGLRLEAGLGVDAVRGQFADRGALEQDQCELPVERRELVALAGGLATVLVDAMPRATVGQAQQLVELVHQLGAALDDQRVQQHDR